MERRILPMQRMAGRSHGDEFGFGNLIAQESGRNAVYHRQIDLAAQQRFLRAG